jgi:4-hydroxy-tetrahydrodipicolinate reductase
MPASPEVLRVVVTGVAGRMGSALVRRVAAAEGMVVAGATERPGGSAIGMDVGVLSGAGPLKVAVGEDLARVVGEGAGQVVIDFTSAEASLAHARICAQAKVPMVVGSTGFSVAAQAEMAQLAKQTAMVMAPNMSVGVNLVVQLAGQLAKALGEAYDVEITEIHHRMKKDAPSGTALRLGAEVAKALGRGPEALRTAREGQVGERAHAEIGIQAVRGGDVVGDHTVFFLGDGERVELTHRATSRETFAAGALRAARWVNHRPPGLYDMLDVLGLGSQSARNPEAPRKG